MSLDTTNMAYIHTLFICLFGKEPKEPIVEEAQGKLVNHRSFALLNFS